MNRGDGSLVEIPGGHLSYEVSGAGPDVILIHPGLWDSRTWDPQVPVLVGATRRRGRAPLLLLGFLACFLIRRDDLLSQMRR